MPTGPAVLRARRARGQHRRVCRVAMHASGSYMALLDGAIHGLGAAAPMCRQGAAEGETYRNKVIASRAIAMLTSAPQLLRHSLLVGLQTTRCMAQRQRV